LPFAKQVWKNALVGHRQGGAAVGNLESDREVVATHQRARLHEAAEPETLARLNVLLGDHRRRREKHDRVAQRVQHQRRRNREYRERTADDRQPPLLARHAWPLALAHDVVRKPLTLFGIMRLYCYA
jgi:hypothetical protein